MHANHLIGLHQTIWPSIKEKHILSNYYIYMNLFKTLWTTKHLTNRFHFYRKSFAPLSGSASWRPTTRWYMWFSWKIIKFQFFATTAENQISHWKQQHCNGTEIFRLYQSKYLYRNFMKLFIFFSFWEMVKINSTIWKLLNV